MRMSAWPVRVALILGLLSAGDGCRSGGDWIYDKPKVTSGQLDRDLAQCRQLTMPKGALTYPSLTGPDREAFNACMEKRGYSATRQ
jgi:hypothetical protein